MEGKFSGAPCGLTIYSNEVDVFMGASAGWGCVPLENTSLEVIALALQKISKFLVLVFV